MTSYPAPLTLQALITATPMRVVCAWCARVITPGTGPMISHGICDPCAEAIDPRD